MVAEALEPRQVACRQPIPESGAEHQCYDGVNDGDYLSLWLLLLLLSLLLDVGRQK